MLRKLSMNLADNSRWKNDITSNSTTVLLSPLHQRKKITLLCKQTTITMEVNIITIVILEACIQRKPYNSNIRALDEYIAHEFINRQVQRLEMTQIPTQNIIPLSTQFKLSILGHKFKIGHANFKTENGSNENKMIQYD